MEAAAAPSPVTLPDPRVEPSPPAAEPAAGPLTGSAAAPTPREGTDAPAPQARPAPLRFGAFDRGAADRPSPRLAGPTMGALGAPLDAPLTLAPFELTRGLAGWIALSGLCVAGYGATAAVGVVHTLAAPAGAALLTAPLLLVGHQFLGLRAAPTALVGTLLRAFCRGGDVALGLVPLALLFAATTDLSPLLLAAGLLGTGFLTLALAMKRLVDLEALASGPDWGARGRMGVLVSVWGGLYALIGLRLAWNLFSFLAS